MKVYRFVVLCFRHAKGYNEEEHNVEGVGKRVEFGCELYDSINGTPIVFDKAGKEKLESIDLIAKMSNGSIREEMDPYEMKEKCSSLPICTFTEKDIKDAKITSVYGVYFEELNSTELDSFVLVDVSNLSIENA